MWLAYVMYQARKKGKDVIFQDTGKRYTIYTRGGGVYRDIENPLLHTICTLMEERDRPWYLVDGGAPLPAVIRKYVKRTTCTTF